MTRTNLLIKTTALSLVAAISLGVAAPAIVMAASSDPVAVTDHSASVSTSETRDALQDTAGVLATSDQVTTKTDADSALVADTVGTSVDAPKDPTQGVSFGATTGPKLEIDLPNADQASDAAKVAPGVVAYDSGNGSANAVQANEDGSVRMLTVIDNPNAPTEYDYKVTVPGGGHIELTPDGGAVVLDSANQPLSMVSAPWAKDARGKQIRTWFTTDGTTLTQHVKHNVPGVTYPITADPAWLVVAAGIVGWAAATCATSVLGSVGLDGVRWAIQRNNWYWNQKVEDALWNCAWGIAGGGILRFAPASVKSWTATQIKNLARTVLKWRI